MDENNGANVEKIITIKELWEIFLRRVILMVLAAMIVGGGFFIYKNLTYVPKYQSYATLYVLRDDSESGSVSGQTSYDFSLALTLVNDCKAVITNRNILEKTIEELNLNMTVPALSSCIKTTSTEDSRIISVAVTTPNAQLSCDIANKIAELGIIEAERIMNVKQLNLVTKAIVNTTPTNSVGKSMSLLVGLGAAVFVYLIFLIIYLLDDSLRTDEEIEKALGIKVIADIPNANSKHGKGKYYSKYGKKYGYGYGYGNNPKKNSSSDNG